MAASFQAAKVTDNVYWVGAIDWAVRDFHGYATRRGTTYNAYLVMADRATLIDTVKGPFFGEMMGRIASVVDPKKVDVLVSNHSEMDHSGCLPQTIDALQPAEVVASKNGVRALKAHFHTNHEITPVDNGQTLSLGNMNLTFIETKMLHWPDSMVSYLDADELLFCQDGFGMHLASAERFADEVPWWLMESEAAKYYANILLPLSPLIEKLLATIPKLGVPISVLAPDHGPIFRTADDIGRILGLYGKWAAQEPTRKVVITHDTMWGSTDLMARAVADGVVAGGGTTKVMKMRAHHRSDIATEVLDAGALVVGSPTINQQLFPTVADVLTYLKGLKPKNLVGASFGSYGWSGEATPCLDGLLDDMGITRVADGLKVQYVPDADAMAQCYELGKQVAAAVGRAHDHDHGG